MIDLFQGTNSTHWSNFQTLQSNCSKRCPDGIRRGPYVRWEEIVTDIDAEILSPWLIERRVPRHTPGPKIHRGQSGS